MPSEQPRASWRVASTPIICHVAQCLSDAYPLFSLLSDWQWVKTRNVKTRAEERSRSAQTVALFDGDYVKVCGNPLSLS